MPTNNASSVSATGKRRKKLPKTNTKLTTKPTPKKLDTKQTKPAARATKTTWLGRSQVSIPTFKAQIPTGLTMTPGLLELNHLAIFPPDLPKTFHRLLRVRPTTSKERDLYQPLSNSRLDDLSHCPTWGVIHSQRQYPAKARSMALEAGEAMHQVFAAIRCWQLWKVQGLKKHAYEAAHRVFGKERWAELVGNVPGSYDEVDQIKQLAMTTLHTSGFYDDPGDAIRTLTNMELASMVYIDERLPYFENWPVWVADVKDPTAPVGIEQVFDVMLEYSDDYLIRFIGTIDGIAVDMTKKRFALEENKTAARLDDAWRESFYMKHQPTGYKAAGMAVFGIPLLTGRVYGLKIKPTHRGEDFVALPIERTPDSIAHWGNWVRYNENMLAVYKHHWEYAPRFTHSCNRFFRSCALIPFCTDTPEGRAEEFQRMVPAEPSPSERAISEM
jgi:hypothetical protein